MKDKNFNLKLKSYIDILIPESKKYNMPKFSDAVNMEKFLINLKKIPENKIFLKKISHHKSKFFTNLKLLKDFENKYKYTLIENYFSSTKVQNILIKKNKSYNLDSKNINSLIKKNDKLKKK